jgi:RNA polymerase primary sigma factor
MPVAVRGRKPGGGAKKPEALIPLKELTPVEAEARRTQLKNLIILGKERGFLTYAEINDHLPDEVLDADQIEGVISMINDMGIQVYDEAPDAETLLMQDSTPAVADEDVVAEAEQALTTVDSEFGRTTDPVRMYMREMGSVDLLTREGEIEIAKRIEEGLRHMVQAISSCPLTIQQILDMAAQVEKDEMRIDELIDGFVEPKLRPRPKPKPNPRPKPSRLRPTMKTRQAMTPTPKPMTTRKTTKKPAPNWPRPIWRS